MPETVVFGYRTVEVPKLCPCNDPGDYAMMVSVDGVDILRCWCGREGTITWESPEERAQYIEDHGA